MIAGYAYIANPNTLNNTVFYMVLIAGTVQILGSIIKSRTWGVVKTKSGKVIPQATLELYTSGKETKTESLYTTTQADTHGRYQFTPENGEYTLKLRSNKGKIIQEKEVTVSDGHPRVDVGVGG